MRLLRKVDAARGALKDHIKGKHGLRVGKIEGYAGFLTVEILPPNEAS